MTTVVAGNCGVGFAPVRPGKEHWLIGLMEGVEDIPGTALTEGIAWTWESFPEYLDAMDRQDLAIDIGSQVAHGAVRASPMGERVPATSPPPPTRLPRWPARARGRRSRCAWLLDLAHPRPPRHRRRPGSGHVRRRRRTVRTRPSYGGRRSGGLRARPAGVAGEDIMAPKIELDWMCRLADAIDLPISFA